MSLEAPVFSSAAVGFRVWKVLPQGLLKSTGNGSTIWRPEGITADCRLGQPHLAPHPDCECGIYAHRELAQVLALLDRLREPFALLGAVAFRGQAWVYQDGLRGEQAAILALAVPRKLASDPALLYLAEKVAEIYRVPLVSQQQLQAMGSQAGSLPPLSDLPERQQPSLADRPKDVDPHEQTLEDQRVLKRGLPQLWAAGRTTLGYGILLVMMLVFVFTIENEWTWHNARALICGILSMPLLWLMVGLPVQTDPNPWEYWKARRRERARERAWPQDPLSG